MRSIWTLALALGAASLALTGCGAPSLFVMPRLQQIDVDGDLGVDSGGSVSAKATLDAMGVEEDKGAFGARVDFDWGAMHLTLATSSSSHDGDGTADATLTQDGTTITAGAPVSTDLSLDLHSLAVTWDLIPTDTVELGLGLGISAVGLDASITETTTGENVATDEILPIPLIAVRGGVAIGPIDLSALVGFVSVDIQGDKATVIDADLMGSWRFTAVKLAGFVALGYRHLGIDVEYDDAGGSAALDIEFAGPYLGVGLSF